MKRPSQRARWSALRLLLLLCPTIVACVTATYGTPHDPSRLAALRRGESTAAELLLALGEPDGRGAARLSPDDPRADVWVYQSGHMEADARYDHMRSEMLIVYVRDGRYEGHLWLPATIDAARW